jgi:hypothetical protein
MRIGSLNQHHGHLVQIPERPVVHIYRMKNEWAWNFWTDLSKHSSERGSTYWFKDLCKGMAHISYSIIPQGGSGYRFEYRVENWSHTIVFHGLHAKKITLQQARAWWYNRVCQYIDIILHG